MFLSKSHQMIITQNSLSFRRKLMPQILLFSKSRPFSKQIKKHPQPTLSTNTKTNIRNTRNIGISAHIDSGKTTLTERILFYTGRIAQMHEVRGKDGVGAKMDSMELEKEKGITIKSAATFARWGDTDLNIIDTPGHVDFTVEVERSMRVLDGAVLIICGASGVQSQSLTVNRQMNRYEVPRVAFVNKLDRQGADCQRSTEELRAKLGLNARLVQMQIGKEKELRGVVDLVEMKALYFEGKGGEVVKEKEVPKELLHLCTALRADLIESVANVDPLLEDLFLEEKEPTTMQLKEAIRRATLSRKFVPVFVGSAFKNKGVQPLLDGIESYLPSPLEVETYATKGSVEEGGQRELVQIDSAKSLLCVAFKLEENAFGQLTWVRVYQGVLRKGDCIYNVSKGGKKAKKIRVSRLVKLHSDEYVDLNQISAGEIGAIFGVECDSGTTFGSQDQTLILEGMKVPQPVISLAIKICKGKDGKSTEKFVKAVKRFMREDPTFKMGIDKETEETVLSGMGELHLDIYKERLLREYGVKIETSPPRVSYREKITKEAKFDYLHKKQTGGAGQFARVIGRIIPVPEGDEKYPLCFENNLRGMNLPPEYVPSIEKAFLFSMKKGPLLDSPMEGVKFAIDDGVAHDVDSSEWAFYQATQGAIRTTIKKTGVILFEPVMKVEVEAPNKFQGSVVSDLHRRGAVINEVQRFNENIRVKADIPLESMFGYATDLRGCTEGKGEFSMEFKQYEQVQPNKQKQLVAKNSQ